MRVNRIVSMMGYVSWLLSKHSEHQNLQAGNIYRIADIKILPSGLSKIIVQVVGKSAFIEFTPKEIVADDALLEGFSKKDIRTITYFACTQTKKPQYRIVMQEFCDQLNEIIFTLKKQGEDKNLVVRTAHQITQDKDLISNLSCEDIQSISYSSGYEHAIRKFDE